MAIDWKSARSGVLWILFSPLAVLMAMISTVKSDTVYHLQIAVCGTWSACGVISGIGRIARVSWAVRLQIILCWIAFSAYAVPGVIMFFYAIRRPSGYVFVPIAVMVFVSGIPFLIYARRRQRELRGQRTRSATG